MVSPPSTARAASQPAGRPRKRCRQRSGTTKPDLTLRETVGSRRTVINTQPIRSAPIAISGLQSSRWLDAARLCVEISGRAGSRYKARSRFRTSSPMQVILDTSANTPVIFLEPGRHTSGTLIIFICRYCIPTTLNSISLPSDSWPKQMLDTRQSIHWFH